MRNSRSPHRAARAISFNLVATTNIPSLPTLFDLSFTLQSGADDVTVGFTSPLLSAPITASDFEETGPGTFVLPVADTQFQVSFAVPAGTISTDPNLGPIGLLLNLEQDTQAIAADEPGRFGIAVLGVALLLLPLHAAGRTRRVRR